LYILSGKKPASTKSEIHNSKELALIVFKMEVSFLLAFLFEAVVTFFVTLKVK
jgi:hypothetical protein